VVRAGTMGSGGSFYGSGSWSCKSMQRTLLLSNTDELKVLKGQRCLKILVISTCER
jgi:hypothetical protein